MLRFLQHTVLGIVGGVFVGYACCLEGQADEFTASWNARPIKQLVLWIGAGFLVGGHGVETLNGCYAVSN